MGVNAAYAELDARSNFSFLEGASHPDEIVSRAAELGLSAIGLADRGTLAGMVRAHVAAAEVGIPLLVGARLELSLGDEPDERSREGRLIRAEAAWFETLEVLAYATDLSSYAALSRLVTEGRLRSGVVVPSDAGTDIPERIERGHWHLRLHRLLALGQRLHLIVVPPTGMGMFSPRFHEALSGLRRSLGAKHLSLALRRRHEADEDIRVQRLLWLAQSLDVSPVATNAVLYHDPQRRMLQDTLRAIRHGCPVEACGFRLESNSERHLKSPQQMAQLFADLPQAMERTAAIAEECRGFSLSQLRWQYPHEVVPAGRSSMGHLRDLTLAGAQERYPEGIPAAVRTQLEHEFSIVADLAYAPYFLTVHDIVRFARSRGILCQGRGAAANSAICFCLGVTAVDPARIDVLFERFVSRERNEPPDIDIDFEHERREEVIQYIYQRYGRERAALCAEVVCYRGRMAVREVGKALGFSLDDVERISGQVGHWHGVAEAGEHEEASSATTPDTIDMPQMDPPQLGAPQRTLLDRIGEAGFDPADGRLSRLAQLAEELIGFPRHLSQHVGGFVISESPLCEIVPVREATMADRSIIEWDKDDLEAMGMLKVDVLALGMLTCVRKAIDLVRAVGDASLAFHTIPAEDPPVYDMLCRADSVGVFQVESRAQMSMLPRLKPRCFYDLVIEVAIVRPGPIQGNMVHPYLRRRRGDEPVVFPDAAVERVLAKTLGVPLFQEQAMSLAMVAAGFSAGEADELRRAIAAWKRRGNRLAQLGGRLINGMTSRGYSAEFADQVFRQIQGFSGYGFPESHAASFALIVYASAWLKCHHPAAFCAAILNSQPMGFYAPAQLVRDARSHGVEVREADVQLSEWDCTLEESAAGLAVRLGLRMVKGLREAEARQLVEVVRQHGSFRSVAALARESAVSVATLRRLALADALTSLGLDRQQALWQVRALDNGPQELDRVHHDQPDAWADLPLFDGLTTVAFDYETTGLSLKAHPMEFLRAQLDRRGVARCAHLNEPDRVRDGSLAQVAGLVLVRQRPMTAKGVVFITIEDESGPANLIIRPAVYAQCRGAARNAVVVLARGKVQRRDGVCHLLVRHIEALDGPVAQAANTSRDFH